MLWSIDAVVVAVGVSLERADLNLKRDMAFERDAAGAGQNGNHSHMQLESVAPFPHAEKSSN